jgi:hypothetical protein
LNWSTNTVPGAADDVTIDVADNPTVTYSSAAGTRTINSLLLHEVFNVSGGNLSITAGVTINNTVTITGAQLMLGGSVTVNAAVTVGDSSTLTVKNGLVLNETLTLGGNYSNLSFSGTQSLTGNGEVVFGGTGDSHSVQSRGDGGSNPATLTIGPGITIHGTRGGTIHGYYGNDTLVK